MNLTREEENILINEIEQKFAHGRSSRRYRDLEQGSKVWRRGYLRTYLENRQEDERDAERQFFLGLIFRSVEQFASEFKEALFPAWPFFQYRAHGRDSTSRGRAEALQSVMEHMLSDPFDFMVLSGLPIRHCAIHGVCYAQTMYNYCEHKKTYYMRRRDPATGITKIFVEDKLEAKYDHPDVEFIYPTRVVTNPDTQFGRFKQTLRWYIIENQRPEAWYLQNQEFYGFKNSLAAELKAMSGSTTMDTVGPNNLDETFNLDYSKTFNDLEYCGPVEDKRLKSKFDPLRTYRINILDRAAIARCDINTHPAGLGLEIGNLIPDIDNSHIGTGLVSPAVDYQRGMNKMINLRFKGLDLAINPNYIVNTEAIPNWMELEGAVGKMFPMERSGDASKVVSPMTVADTSGHNWEQMAGFLTRDHDKTVGQSSSRLGVLEDEKRLATELNQIKEGGDKRTNSVIFNYVRTFHKPLLGSLTKLLLAFWSTPLNLRIIANEGLSSDLVHITPDDIQNVDAELNIIDATGGTTDQNLAFFSKMYEWSKTDPLLNRAQLLMSVMKNSRIIRDPQQFMNLDIRSLMNINPQFTQETMNLPADVMNRMAA